MDIKLRARLSAYSKIESINSLNSNTPVPDATAAGNVLGVSNTGNYTLFPMVKSEDIDSLFTNTDTETIVSKEDIDSLFEKDNSEFESVTKDEIDSLFKESENTPVIGTVSHEDIDSLFN